MARPIMRRLSPLVLALLFALPFVLWAPPPSSNAQEGAAVRLTLLSQTSWNCPTATADLAAQQVGWSCPSGRELDLRFRAQNLGTEPLSELAIGVTLYSRVLTRSAYEASLVSDPSIVIDAGTLPREDAIEPGETRDFEISLSLEQGIDPDQSGLYPVKLDLRSGITSVAELRTPAIFLVREPEIPLGLSWTFVLAHPIVFAPDGTFTDPSLEIALGPGGRLNGEIRALLELASDPTAAPVDVALSPVLLTQLGRMRHGYEVSVGGETRRVPAGEGGAALAGRALENLRTIAAAPNVEVTALPFSAPEIPSLYGGGLGRDVVVQLERGREVASTFVGTEMVEGFLRPPGAALDDPTLRGLSAAGIRTLLVGPSTVELPEQPLDFAGPATTSLGNGSLAAIVPDPSSEELLTSVVAEDPVLAAQVLLGELTTIWQEAPGEERGIALVLSEDAPLPGPFFPPLVRDVATAPWLAPAAAEAFVQTFPPTDASVLANPSFRRFPTTYVTSIRQARRRIDMLRSMLPSGSLEPDRLETMLLLAEARQFLISTSDGLAFIDAVKRSVRDSVDDLALETVQSVTLTSESAGIPVTVSNEGPHRLRFSVRLDSPWLLDEPTAALELAPGDSQTVRLQAQMRSTGRFPVQVQMVSRSGRLIGQQTLAVRSTAYNRVALLITIGAALVLVAVWARRFLPPSNTVPPRAEPPSEDSTRAFVRNTVVMSTGTALSRLTGFLRLSAMAYALGITESRLPDAYNVANITPNILYELALGGILTSVVVPVVVEWMQTHGRDAAWDVVRRLFTITLVVLSAIAVLGIVLAPWIVDLYTVGYPETQRVAVHDLATFFLRFFMPQVVFYGIGAVAAGLLNSHRRFAAPMFAPIANNLIVIATFLIFAAMPDPATGSHELATGAQQLVLAIGTTLGVVAMTAALWPSVQATGFRFRWIGGIRDEAIGRIGRLATWVIVYVVANQLGYLVVLILAGEITGGYSAYAAAFILFQLPHAIFAVSILTALLPAMSSRWAADDLDGYRALLSQGIRATATVLIPAALGYLVLARPIVRLLLEHGATLAASTDLVAEVLFAFAIGLFAFSAFQFLLRASYAMQDTRTPALVNVAALSLNVIVNLLFFLVLELGIPGLALGHAVSYVFASSVLLVLIRRRIGRIDGRRIVASLGRILVAGVATAAVAWLVAEGFERWLGTATLGQQAAQVLGAVVAGLAVFVASAAALRIEEVGMVRRQVTARWR